MEDSTSKQQPEEAQQDVFQFSDFIEWTFSNKLFILLSVIFCLLAGVAYIYRSQPVYQCNSTIMLRTDMNGNSQIGELAAFADLGMGATGIDAANEIEAFRSPAMMKGVVERLGLNVAYCSKNWIGRITDWYDKTPIEVAFSSMPEVWEDGKVGSASFSVQLEADSASFRLSDFVINGKKIDAKEFVAKPSEPVVTPVGTVVVKPTACFDKKDAFPISVTYKEPYLAAMDFTKSLSVELADKYSSVLQFSFTDTSAKRAEDVLNTLLDVYNETWIEDNSRSSVNTAKFISERLVSIEKELGMADADVERFKREHKLIDISAETMLVTEESSKYAEESFKMNNQLQIARYIREYLTDRSKISELLPSNSGIENDNLEVQIGEYNKLMLDRQRLVGNSSDTNPLIADMDNRLAMMRSGILRSVDNLIGMLQIQVNRIAAQESSIDSRIGANPGKVRELLAIERHQKIKEQLYLYLLQKLEETELKASIAVDNTRLLMPATEMPGPVSPRKMIILAAALVVGLCIPYGYMFLINAIDTTVRGRQDLKQLSLPVVGEVPQTGKTIRFHQLRTLLARRKDTEAKAVEVVVKQHGRDVINEAFRVIRTNLDFMLSRGAGTQTILFTSFNPGSGKTFTSLNIAASLALKGKRVAIADLDLRKASLSKSAGSHREGISAYLNGKAGLQDVAVKNALGIEGLDLFPVGTLPPNPSELLLEKRLDMLGDELRAAYDYVLLDCPPAEIVADAQIISRIADRTVFVMRVGIMDRRMLPDVERLYETKRYPNMSLLLNGSKQSSKYGYSRYGYGGGKFLTW